jgi:hypothetical protein
MGGFKSIRQKNSNSLRGFSSSFELSTNNVRRYWRIYITAGGAGFDNYYNIQEIEMRLTTGGVDQCTGGTASASSVYTGLGAANAFDNDTAGLNSYWHADAGTTGWIQYDFGVDVNKPIAELWMYPRGQAQQFRMPSTFLIQSSPNGFAWRTEASYSGVVWVAATPQTFAVS